MYAIVDIETTGGYAAASAITEISVFIHDGTKQVKHFETLINPQQSIPRYITALTGIDDDMVNDAPAFDEIADVLFDLIAVRQVVSVTINTWRAERPLPNPSSRARWTRYQPAARSWTPSWSRST